MYRENEAEDRSILILASEGQVRGYDRATGALKWNYDARETDWFGGRVNKDRAFEVVLHQSYVYVVGSRGMIVLQYATGRLLHEVRFDVGHQYARPSVLLDAGLLYIAVGDLVMCYGLDAQCRWAVRTEGHHCDGPLLAFPGNVRPADQIH